MTPLQEDDLRKVKTDAEYPSALVDAKQGDIEALKALFAKHSVPWIEGGLIHCHACRSLLGLGLLYGLPSDVQAVAPIQRSTSAGNPFDRPTIDFWWNEVNRDGYSTTQEERCHQCGSVPEMQMMQTLCGEHVSVSSYGLTKSQVFRLVSKLDEVIQEGIDALAGAKLNIRIGPKLVKCASVSELESAIAAIDAKYPDMLDRRIVNQARAINDEIMRRDRNRQPEMDSH